MRKENSVWLNRLLTEEEFVLRSLRLPIPRPTVHPLTHIRTDLPFSFELPPHVTFSIPTPSRSAPQAVYVIVGDQRTLESAEREGLKSGLSVVAFKYPGLWVNRDPYELYKRIAEYGLDGLTPETVAPLCLVDAFSPSQLQRLEWQANLWSAATGELKNLLPVYLGLPPLPQPELALPPPASSEPLVTLKLLPVQASRITSADSFLDQVWTARHPLAFELISEPGTAHFQLSFASEDRALIEGQLKSHFQKFFIEPIETPQVFSSPLDPCYAVRAWLPTFSDSIKQLASFSISPYDKLFAFTRDAAPRTQFALQVLFAPIAARTIQTLQTTLERYQRQLASYSDHLASEHELLTESVREYRVEDFQEPARYWERVGELRGQAQQLRRSNRDHIRTVSAYSDRISQSIRRLSSKYPPWLVSVRLMCSNRQLLTRLRDHFFDQYETSSGGWQISGVEQVSAPDRRITRWGVVSTGELSALIHFPASDGDTLETVSAKQSEPPPLYTQPGLILGTSQTGGRSQVVTLPEAVRDRHAYILGRTRSGKSTLMINMIVQGIIQGEGLCVIDPHGDLVEGLLDYIPSERVSDTIYLNLTDSDHPIPLNVLNASDPNNSASLVDDVVGTFKRLVDSSTWGYRMENILRSAVATLTRAPFPASFFDLARLLKDEAYRRSVLQHISYGPLLEFWEKDFYTLPKDAIQPLIQRMNRFADFPVLYAMLSTPESHLNFDEIMQQKKILLVNLSSGRIGEDNSKLIGCLLISQLQLAAMRRASLPPERRVPFSLYADEFQNMIVAPFDKILSEAGKYRLRLIVAHQFISQLDDKTRDALLGNVGTMLVLPINEKDAGALKHSMGNYSMDDILNLDAARHEALCRPATKAKDTFVFTTNAPPKPLAQSNRHAIIEHARARYSRRPEAKSPPQTEKPTPPPAPKIESPATPQPTEAWCLSKRPSKAQPQSFGTAQQRIMYYVTLAGYLTTPQITRLCYDHLSHNPASQKVSASNDLKKLQEKKLLKELSDRRPKIYYAGNRPNVTAHDLTLRDLFVKISMSNLEITSFDFSSQLGKLNPDLRVDFVTEDGSPLETYWEYDTGTEPLAELVSKVQRYAEAKPVESPVVFVFETVVRLDQARKQLVAPFCITAALPEFSTLADPAFYFSGPDRQPAPQPLFG